VIAATGLELQLLGGMRVTVDGREIDFARCLSYKGMMLSDVPNLAYAVGYTNASWTLRADLVSLYVCRLLAHMDRSGMRQCTPRLHEPRPAEKPWTEFSSGYVQRSIARFPKQGTRGPWRLHQNYLRDLLSFRFGRVRDGAMAFSNPA
jgi:monooxygenase